MNFTRLNFAKIRLSPSTQSVLNILTRRRLICISVVLVYTHKIGYDVSTMELVGILLYPTQLCIFCDFIIPRLISFVERDERRLVEGRKCGGFIVS